jgi:hypothetical protein
MTTPSWLLHRIPITFVILLNGVGGGISCK